MITFESATTTTADPNLPDLLRQQSLELEALRAENERLHKLLTQRLRAPDVPTAASRTPVDIDRSAGEKIAFVLGFTRERTDSRRVGQQLELTHSG